MATRVIQDIWHGDSVELCARLKNNVNCVITDPPFGVNNQSNMAKQAHSKQLARKIANDETPERALEVFDAVMDVLLPKTVENADLYIFTSYQVLSQWLLATDRLTRHGYHRKGILVWAKDGPGMGDLNTWGIAHEFIIFLKKGDRPRSAQRRSGVLSIPQVRPDNLIHPHEKPLALLEELIKHSTDPGDLIVDPFAGSGSTIRAAKQLGRSGLGIEYDEFNYAKAKQALTANTTLFG